jgi:hypothetical protein
LSGSIGSTVRIETYNNGVFVEGKDVVTSLLGIESSLLDGSGLATVGFITTQGFDEVRIIYNTLVGCRFYRPGILSSNREILCWFSIGM